MFEYSEVAVEIWHLILLAVIDLPYLLDTHLPGGDVDLWRSTPRYHDQEVYAESERQRKMLRLVCHSWRGFADRHKYRWITYDSGSTADATMQEEALEAVGSARSEATGRTANATSTPRRIMFNVTNDGDMDLFRKTVDHCSRKVTTFFAKCGDGYEDPVYEYFVSRSSRLPLLRCLAVPAPKYHRTPLQAVSDAFPQLVTFAMWNDRPFFPREGDILALPELDELELDISTIHPDTLKKWRLPAMINLTTPMYGNRAAQGNQLSLQRIRSLGANLTYINIYRVDGPIRLPVEFWKWCPCLVEFLSFFSYIYIDTPAPLDHPLRRVIHWPHYDHVVNTLVEATSRTTDPAVLLSLQCLPPGLNVFAVWHTWSAYLDFLATGGRFNQREREDILLRMNEICRERSIRVEDEHRVELDEFLVSKGIRKTGDALESGFTG